MILVPRVILIANPNIVVDHMTFSWLLLSYIDFRGYIIVTAVIQ